MQQQIQNKTKNQTQQPRHNQHNTQKKNRQNNNTEHTKTKQKHQQNQKTIQNNTNKKQKRTTILQNTRQIQGKIHQRQTRTKQLRQNNNTNLRTTIQTRQKRIPRTIQETVPTNRLLPEHHDKTKTNNQHQRKIPKTTNQQKHQNNTTPITPRTPEHQ